MTLPSLVKDRLIHRNELDTATKKTNEYRARKYVKNYLKDLEEILWILDTLPETQISKLFTYNDVYQLFDLTEKLVKKLGPSPVAAPDENGIRHVFRHFNVELTDPFQGMKSATARVKVTYEPASDETVFFNRFTGHIMALEGIYDNNEHAPHTYKIDEFNEQILKPLQATKKNVTVETIAIVGFGIEKNPTIKEASDQFDKANKEVLGKEPSK
jgi:hypothetical protein